MRARRLVVAGGLFIVAALLFVWRNRNANYGADEKLFMSLAALCGLMAIGLLYRALKAPEK